MNFSLPTDALYLHGDPFYRIVEEFCGSEALELLRFQLIDSSADLLEIDDVFSILQIESDRTTSLKEVLGVSGENQLGNYSFFVMPGIRLKLEKSLFSLHSYRSHAFSRSSFIFLLRCLNNKYIFSVTCIHTCEFCTKFV